MLELYVVDSDLFSNSRCPLVAAASVEATSEGGLVMILDRLIYRRLEAGRGTITVVAR